MGLRSSPNREPHWSSSLMVYIRGWQPCSFRRQKLKWPWWCSPTPQHCYTDHPMLTTHQAAPLGGPTTVAIVHRAQTEKIFVNGINAKSGFFYFFITNERSKGNWLEKGKGKIEVKLWQHTLKLWQLTLNLWHLTLKLWQRTLLFRTEAAASETWEIKLQISGFILAWKKLKLWKLRLDDVFIPRNQPYK